MENIVVAVRFRPLNDRELKDNATTDNWKLDGGTATYSPSPSLPGQSFTFDQVYDPSTTTQQLYDGAASSIVASAVNGFNGTVFAYGQTSSGKTFTMRGSEANPGIIPMAIQQVFDNMDPERQYLFRVAYMEIYNEIVTDLLAGPGGGQGLKIHEDIKRGMFVDGLKEEVVGDPGSVLALMEFGEKRRRIAATSMNDCSSRSHTIFKMIIESQPKIDPLTGEKPTENGAVQVSMLNLVDLAGSESVKHTNATGARQVEGGHINKSLLTLGQVIKKLSEGDTRHVPYRDSKLTRILESALGGNSRTAVVCAATLAPKHSQETINTLKFASRAKSIVNNAVQNEVVDDATLLRRYEREIRGLKKQLASGSSPDPELEAILDEKTRLEMENKKLRMEQMEKAVLTNELYSSRLAASKGEAGGGASEADGAGSDEVSRQRARDRRGTCDPSFFRKQNKRSSIGCFTNTSAALDGNLVIPTMGMLDAAAKRAGGGKGDLDLSASLRDRIGQRRAARLSMSNSGHQDHIAALASSGNEFALPRPAGVSLQMLAPAAAVPSTADIDEMRETMRQLQEQLVATQNERDTVLANKDMAATEAEETLTAAEGEIERVVADCEHLMTQLNEAREECVSAQAEAEQARSAAASTAPRGQSGPTENDMARTNIRLEAATARADLLQSQADEAKIEFAALEERAEFAEAELQTVHSHTNDSSGLVAQYEAQIKDMSDEREVVEAELTSRGDQIEKLEELLQDVEQWERQVSELQTMKRELEIKVNKKNTQLGEAAEQMDDMDEAQKSLEKEVKSLSSGRSEMMNENKLLGDRAAEAEAARDIAAAKSKQLEDDLLDCQWSRDDLKLQLESQSASSEEVSALMSERDSLKKKLAQVTQACDLQEQQKASLDSRVASLSSHLNETKAALSAAQVFEPQLSDSLARLADATAEKAHLASAVSLLEDQKASFGTQLAAKDQDGLNVRDECSRLQDELEMCRDLKEEASALSRHQREGLTRFEEQVADLKERQRGVEEANAVADERATASDAHAHSVEVELESIKAELSEANKAADRRAGAGKELEKVRAEKAAADHRCKEVQSEKVGLDRECKELKRQLSFLQKDRDASIKQSERSEAKKEEVSILQRKNDGLARDLEAMLDDMGTKDAELSHARSRVELVEAEHREMALRMDAVESASGETGGLLHAKEMQVAELKNGLRVHEASLQRCAGEMDALEHDVASKVSELAIMHDSVAKLRESESKAQSEATAAVHEAERLCEELSAFHLEREEGADVASDLAQARAELEEFRSESVSRAQAVSQSQADAVSDANARTQHLQTDLFKLRAVLNETEDAAKAKVLSCAGEAASITRRAEEAEQRVSTLEKRFADFRATASTERQRLQGQIDSLAAADKRSGAETDEFERAKSSLEVERARLCSKEALLEERYKAEMARARAEIMSTESDDHKRLAAECEDNFVEILRLQGEEEEALADQHTLRIEVCDLKKELKHIKEQGQQEGAGAGDTVTQATLDRVRAEAKAQIDTAECEARDAIEEHEGEMDDCINMLKTDYEKKETALTAAHDAALAEAARERELRQSEERQSAQQAVEATKQYQSLKSCYEQVAAKVNEADSDAARSMAGKRQAEQVTAAALQKAKVAETALRQELAQSHAQLSSSHSAAGDQASRLHAQVQHLTEELAASHTAAAASAAAPAVAPGASASVDSMKEEHQCELDSMQNSLDEMHAQLEEADEEIEHLKQQSATSNGGDSGASSADVQRLQSELAQKTRLETLHADRICKLTDEKDALATAWREERSRNEADASAQATAARRSTLDRPAESADMLSAQRRCTLPSADDLEDGALIADLEEELETARSQIKELALKLKFVQDTNNELMSEAEDGKVGAVVAADEAELARAGKEIDSLRLALSTAQRDASENMAVLGKVKGDMDRLARGGADVAGQSEELHRTRFELQRERAKSQHLQEQAGELTTVVQAREAAFATLKAEMRTKELFIADSNHHAAKADVRSVRLRNQMSNLKQVQRNQHAIVPSPAAAALSTASPAALNANARRAASALHDGKENAATAAQRLQHGPAAVKPSPLSTGVRTATAVDSDAAEPDPNQKCPTQ